MKREILLPGKTYHLYGKTVANETGFKKEKHYEFFLKKFTDYMLPVADTLGYSILPTEYHFIVKVCETKNLIAAFNTADPQKLGDLMCIEFGKFLLSYTKALNKDENRRGPVFMKPFRREEIQMHDDFIYKLRNIHTLPVDFQLCGHPADYRFSSYAKIVSSAPSLISTDILFKRFNSLKWFIEFHNEILRSCHRMAA